MERFDIGTFALLANVVEFNSVHLPGLAALIMSSPHAIRNIDETDLIDYGVEYEPPKWLLFHWLHLVHQYSDPSSLICIGQTLRFVSNYAEPKFHPRTTGASFGVDLISIDPKLLFSAKELPSSTLCYLASGPPAGTQEPRDRHPHHPHPRPPSKRLGLHPVSAKQASIPPQMIQPLI